MHVHGGEQSHDVLVPGDLRSLGFQWLPGLPQYSKHLKFSSKDEHTTRVCTPARMCLLSAHEDLGQSGHHPCTKAQCPK